MDGLAIAASLSEIRAAAEGGFLDAIHRPARGTVVLRVSAETKVRMLLSPRQAAIHLTELTLPNPSRPDPFVMLLRKHVRGGCITAVRQWGLDRVVTLEIDRRTGRRVRRFELVAELTGVRGNLLLLEEGTVIGSAHRDRRNRPGSSYASLRPQPKQAPDRVSAEGLAGLLEAEDAARVLAASIDGVGRHTAKDLLQGLEDLAGIEQASAVRKALRTVLSHVANPIGCVLPDEDRATFYPVRSDIRTYPSFGQALDATSTAMPKPHETDRKPVREQIRRSIARRRRTLEKLTDWLDAADGADRLRFLADLLMIHQSDVPSGVEGVELIDPATGGVVDVRLLPRLSAIENAQRMYERAKRLRRGKPHVTSRIERLEAEIRILEAGLAAIEGGRPIDERATALLPGKPKPPPVPPPSLHRLDVDGFAVLIGRNAIDNDRLLREAAPNDLWLHAKDVAGSHVIVKRGGRTTEVPDSVVLRAARLAAEHSKASGERRVEVIVAEAKHVRKPKGARPGLANVAQCATLTVAL